MTWPRALLCWLVAGVLLLVVRATEPPPPDAADRSAASSAAGERVDARATVADAVPSATPELAYEIEPAALERVAVRRGDRTVVLRQQDGAWTVVEPARL
ncbi:MAG: hypothetical protein U0842_06615 [Candidatus Binatia bacterium]